jgi:protein phosphatase
MRQMTGQDDEAAGFTLTAAMLTDRGRVRETNEDAVAYMLPADGGPPRALAMVADGMGGHAAGEVASAMAVQIITRHYLDGTGGDIASRLAASFAAANDAIRARACAVPECAGMGTTCTTLAIQGGDAYLAHIGDSRAYRLSGGVLAQISVDHSLVGRLLSEGVISAAEADIHPERHVILQALGTAEHIAPQCLRLPQKLEPGDRFLLCSDGLSDLVPKPVLAAALVHPPAQACRVLLDAALAAGGSDNVSVGVIAVDARTPAGGPDGATRTGPDRATRTGPDGATRTGPDHATRPANIHPNGDHP